MKYKKIGIDLGSYSIKITTLKETLGVYSIENFEEYKVDEHIGKSEYFGLLKKYLMDFTKKYKIKFALLNISIPYVFPIVRFEQLNMPIVSKKFLEKSLIFELQDKEPEYNINDIHYIWEIISEIESSDEYEMILVSIEKEIIKELAKLNKIRWKIETLELQPITISRILKGDSVVVDFGYETTKIYFYKKNKLSFINIIQSGSKNIEDIIRNNSSEETYEELKNNVYVYNEFFSNEDFNNDNEKNVNDNISDEKSGDINDKVIKETSEQITDKITDIFLEIKRIIRRYELNNQITFSEVLYIGGISNIKYFEESFSSDLDIDTRMLEFFTPSSKKEQIRDLNTFNIAGMVASNKNLNYENDFNFKKFIKFNIDLQPIIFGLLCLSISFHLGMYSTYIRYDKQVVELKSIKSNQSNSLQELDKNTNQFLNTQEKADKIIKTVIDLNNQKKWLSDILYFISDKTPEKIVVSKIEIVDKNIVLEGYSQNYSDIGFFAMHLEEVGNVSIDAIDNNVDLEIYTEDISKSNDSKINKRFAITLQYKDEILKHE